MVAAAKQAGALVAVDVLHPGSEREFARMRGALAGADWFWPNGDQLRALTGQADLDLAIADVLALGTGGVAVTLGGDGCLVTAAGGGLIHVPAIEVAVVDTTGCGDGFNAGMLTGLLLGCDRWTLPGSAPRAARWWRRGSDPTPGCETWRTPSISCAPRTRLPRTESRRQHYPHAATAAKETGEHVACRNS